MNQFGRRVLALAAASAAACGLLTGPALAHPHGVMACGLAVHYENGQPAVLAARLVMDAAHSAQALASVRDPQTGQLDGRLQQRLLFMLKSQMARANWLLAVESGGVAADIEPASEPLLVVTDDGRVGVDVALRLQLEKADAAPAPWTFSCRDPSWYWTTELVDPSVPVRVTGCTTPRWSPVQKILAGASAGSVQLQLACEK